MEKNVAARPHGFSKLRWWEPEYFLLASNIKQWAGPGCISNPRPTPTASIPISLSNNVFSNLWDVIRNTLNSTIEHTICSVHFLFQTNPPSINFSIKDIQNGSKNLCDSSWLTYKDSYKNRCTLFTGTLELANLRVIKTHFHA